MKKILTTAMILAGTLTAIDGFIFAEEAAAEVRMIENILSVRAIAEVYGDGEKIARAVIEYPKNLSAKKISAADFRVAGKTIESVSVDKNFVILNFANENTASDRALNIPPKNNGGAPMRFERKRPDLNLAVAQIGTIYAADGTEFYPSGNIIYAEVSAPVVESFEQHVYADETGLEMPYNIYLPENYDGEKKFPLVVFIADASANNNEVTTPLIQGNGATSFAARDFQKKHPCIILAPQYTTDLVDEIGMMTTDENVWTRGLSLTANLIFDVIKNYAVDTDRIYGTGQSQGGMANIAISDRYPELFAAQILVACQWDVDEMKILRDKNLWIVVCEGDMKAFPAMNAAVENWEESGAKVASNEIFWDSKAPVAELNKKIRQLAKKRANINYTVFAGGNHMYTWSFAYNLDALREWLFRQKNF